MLQGYKRQRSEKTTESALSDSSDSDIVITTSLAKKKESAVKDDAVSEPQTHIVEKSGKTSIKPKEDVNLEQTDNLSTQELVQLLKTRLDKSSGYIPDLSYFYLSFIHFQKTSQTT